MRAFQPVRFELVSRHGLSTITPASLSLSLPPSLPLPASLHIVMHTENRGNLKPCWKTRCDHDRQLLFQEIPGCSRCTCTSSVAETHHLFSFRCFSVLPYFDHLLPLHIHTVTSGVGGVPRLEGSAVRQVNIAQPQPRQAQELAVNAQHTT